MTPDRLDPEQIAEMTTWRRDFHAHPELGQSEHRTAARVGDLLESFGLDVHRGIGGTGVVGILQCGNGQGRIGFRADMDALPITETGDVAYKSQTDGVMHACGHDGHMSMLLGAAKELTRARSFDGGIVFIFQPNEENGGGARAMIEDGLFDRFAMDEVYGMHNLPGLPIGHFATRRGPIMASESLFEIEITARGGHAAMPHMGVDAITVGAEIVGALQTIVSRKLNPGENGVVSVTAFETDGKRNILPGRALLSGDARGLTNESTRTIEKSMRQITDGICAAHGVSATVSFNTCFRATINAPDPTHHAVAAASAVSGQHAVNSACAPLLASEDFAHLATERPGCFILTGNGTDGPGSNPLHASDYDFCDDLLSVGANYWIRLAHHRLKG